MNFDLTEGRKASSAATLSLFIVCHADSYNLFDICLSGWSKEVGGCPDGEACFSNMEENNGVGDIVQETTCEGHFKVESPN